MCPNGLFFELVLARGFRRGVDRDAGFFVFFAPLISWVISWAVGSKIKDSRQIPPWTWPPLVFCFAYFGSGLHPHPSPPPPLTLIGTCRRYGNHIKLMAPEPILCEDLRTVCEQVLVESWPQRVGFRGIIAPYNNTLLSKTSLQISKITIKRRP